MSTPEAISPLAPTAFPDMAPVAGVRLASAACGVKYAGRTDVLLAELAAGTTVAGVFTKSKTASAPVDWCRKSLPGGQAQALLVNSGNANAFTGVRGLEAVEATVKSVADRLTCRPSRVFCASTGVIGEPLPAEKITEAMDGLVASLADANNAAGWEAAARAIMTTDTFPKGASAVAEISGVRVTINGIAKGSGMIAPDMATMLSFLFTDAALPAGVLQSILAEVADRTFNAITVDSDTSTSDTVILFSTGAGADHREPDDAADPALDDFKAALETVMGDLARQVVRDGEGATKFIEVTVTGAETDFAAKRIALSIANSPLVKTAIAGEDANWGRIVMAVGKAGEAADRDKLAISIGGIEIAAEGAAVEGYDETPVAQHMNGDEIEITVDVGIAAGEGAGRATVWTCDLTHGYITINADYRS
ncbi:MAG: bifunctional glutamate N-acetyltransferase/amino-acid acetyltransferase ArgJ [Rhodospirillaceae bacterium]|nr:bifunctional glutamate N-acetyltransferase/amino-acid acetyltransferase ArgJ [Rhodospirillaceae bacterium]MBT7249151.1 bifunctional glutamate N-acetyltransferase/amino-acid acetyltransferase ArgJ [Rhodospirillaceae bacterium]MBT7510062.1 bifunctional glutamate N-acetyltransferase/amino-acid acetyltransferase ArgJ [Rhodospirillaceae bacterium]